MTHACSNEYRCTLEPACCLYLLAACNLLSTVLVSTEAGACTCVVSSGGGRGGVEGGDMTQRGCACHQSLQVHDKLVHVAICRSAVLAVQVRLLFWRQARRCGLVAWLAQMGPTVELPEP